MDYSCGLSTVIMNQLNESIIIYKLLAQSHIGPQSYGHQRIKVSYTTQTEIAYKALYQFNALGNV